MKNKRKLLIFTIVALLCMNLMATTSFAAAAPADTDDSQGIHIMAEETEWVYRNNNGVVQKRLWSLTYAKWLTDWITVSV